MFRFTIRDVLWLTVVAGLGVGWWIDRNKTRAAWRSDRDRIQATWQSERDEWQALLDRIRVLHKLPTAERQELEHTIGGKGNARTQ